MDLVLGWGCIEGGILEVYEFSPQQLQVFKGMIPRAPTIRSEQPKQLVLKKDSCVADPKTPKIQVGSRYTLGP